MGGGGRSGQTSGPCAVPVVFLLPIQISTDTSLSTPLSMNLMMMLSRKGKISLLLLLLLFWHDAQAKKWQCIAPNKFIFPALPPLIHIHTNCYTLPIYCIVTSSCSIALVAK